MGESLTAKLTETPDETIGHPAVDDALGIAIQRLRSVHGCQALAPAHVEIISFGLA